VGKRKIPERSQLSGGAKLKDNGGKTMIYEHVSITVKNLDRSVAFYTKVFGFKVLKKTAMNAYLYLGEDMLEIMQANTAEEKSTSKEKTDVMELLAGHVGLNHLGFRVEDMESAIESFEKLSQEFGGRVLVRPFEYRQQLKEVAEVDHDKLRRVLRSDPWRIAVVVDPDGILIEIQER